MWKTWRKTCTIRNHIEIINQKSINKGTLTMKPKEANIQTNPWSNRSNTHNLQTSPNKNLNPKTNKIPLLNLQPMNKSLPQILNKLNRKNYSKRNRLLSTNYSTKIAVWDHLLIITLIILDILGLMLKLMRNL